MRTLLLLSTCLILFTGCGDRAPAGDAPPAESTVSPEIFAGLPVLPGSRLAGGSGDAAEAVVTVPLPADSVARFYRQVLADGEWDIRGDATAPDGEVTLHARSPDGRPIWIMVAPAGTGRARVSVIATAPDSATTGH